MRSCYLFLLVYVLGSYYGTTSAQSNVSCTTGQTCEPEGEGAHHGSSETTNTTHGLTVIDPATYFLQCVGLPSTDTGRDHMRRLKQILEALTDVYTFMRSSMTGVPFLSVQGMLDLNDKSDPLQNEALVEMWLEVKIKPLLKSITKHFLSCLSTKNFSCSTYQMMVKELSHHFSEMNPVRQRWIYTFFMYPFLSGDRVAGCVKRNESSEDWLMKNFGAFSVMARVKDFSTLNMVFSGLEVLHLLSPAQKAELLLNPHIVGFNNDTLSLVFYSLMTGGSGPYSTMSPGGHHTRTTPGHHYTTTASPGGHHKRTTPGHHYTPTASPGGHHNRTTPGHHYTPTASPGGHHNRTTPGHHYTTTASPGGGHHNRTTPGHHYTTTASPGGHHNRTTPGHHYTPTASPGGHHNRTTSGHHYTPTASPGGHHNRTTPGHHYTTTASPGGHHNRTTPGHHYTTTASPGGGHHNWTTPGHHYTSTVSSGGHHTPTGPVTYPGELTDDSFRPPSPHHGFNQVSSVFGDVFRPVSSFVRGFVSFTKQRNVSEIRSTTLTQFLLNWTLAELAQMYTPQNTSVPAEGLEFDVTNVEDWYQHVVMPVLRTYLDKVPADMLPAALNNENITLAFHHLFYLDKELDSDEDNQTSEIQDVCSITLDKHPCGLTDAVVHVARVVHCAARSDLTMSENTVMTLLNQLTQRLNLLIGEFATANFTQLASEFREIFSETEAPSLTQEHLNDPDFIKLWFQIKLLPLLPDVPLELLSCLSTKNFTCPVYQTIVEALGKQMSFMDVGPMHNHNIYEHFLRQFLLHHNTSEPQCVSSANNSAEWLQKNFGFFSEFGSVTDFYQLNPHFSGLETLPLLSPKQKAQMLLLLLPSPPDKDVVIERVFDFLLESPEDRKYPEVLHYLVHLAMKVGAPCDVYRNIFEQLYNAIPSLPLAMEPITWISIEKLIRIAPGKCVPENITCPVTQFNEHKTCKGHNSSDLESYLNQSVSHMNLLCSFPLEKYACAKLENFTARQLAGLFQCDLPGNSSHSKTLWKMLLTKLSFILNSSLDILANMSTTAVSPAASQILDVIGEIRVSFLTDEQLGNSSVIRLWFSSRLRAFLPSASGRFLHCLIRRNMSCHSYQQILQVFSHVFANMTEEQQHVVLDEFILMFLSQPQTGPGCVSGFNSSEWLKENLGPFSEFLSLKHLLRLNPTFNPLEALQLLTPKQIVEILMLNLPTLPEKNQLINILFDFLTESPGQMKFQKFLSFLPMVVQQGNLSCSSIKTLFNRMDLAMATAPLSTASTISHIKLTLSQHIPLGCIIYSGQCNITLTNQTDICIGVNSTLVQLHLDNGQMDGHFCDFPVVEFACASLSALKAQDLAEVLKCSRWSNSSGSRAEWKLLLTKASRVLDDALDLLANMTLDPTQPALSLVLDAIREIRLDSFSLVNLNHPAVIQLWFKRRLGQFLPAVSKDFLSCLATKGLNCSTYQQIVQILSGLKSRMPLSTQMVVFTHFIQVFLTRNDTADPSCSLHVNNSAEWLQRNLGAFSDLVTFNGLLKLYPNFSAMEALQHLTVRQLAEVASTPRQLASPAQVVMVTNHVPNNRLAAFFDDFSPAITGHEQMFPHSVRSAMLGVVFSRANLSHQSVGDSAVLVWLHNRLRPLLVGLDSNQVAPFFNILARRNCSTEQQGVQVLNSTISSLSEDTKKEIHDHIINTLKGGTPLRCYGNNYNHSFYGFLEATFEGFQFPKLTSFLSLMPHDRMPLLLNSMPPSDLGAFLRRPDTVDNDALLCALYHNYDRTRMFLEKEDLPAAIRRPTLPCVWPLALTSSKRSEVDEWFDRSLRHYLTFLTKTLISPSSTYNASCLAFQKLVSVMGDYNYTASDFVSRDVFDSVRVYLTSASNPRCFNATDPELNSTAWFAEYIGFFFQFLTLEDLLMLGSAEVIQVFAVNPANIALLNHSSLPLNLTNYYTELVYLQDSNFNPLLLPLICRCVAPGPAFTQLTEAQSLEILSNLTSLCTDLDPQVAAALSGNFGENIDSSTITALGKESKGLSTGQINMIKAKDLMASLSILTSITDWNLGQARAIIQILSTTMTINNASSLLMLGSLVTGVPSSVIGSINGSELLNAGGNNVFIAHLLSAPSIVQQTFVTKIVKINENSEVLVDNVPDDLASEIPRASLLGFSGNSNFSKINKKKWKHQQVELFFGVIAVESATSAVGGAANLSSSVLQGFTCTSVRTVKKVQVKRLIRACRRRDKVTLVENQLTCMYNHIRTDSDVTSFELFPPDLLLYYDYSLVPSNKCRSYFEQLSEADFSVFSAVLSYKRTALFDNARSCLGITSTSLTEDQISVLGNMCCTLNGVYIENSDPSILEKLKNCADLSSDQAAAVESLLVSGRTKYGAVGTWDGQTLRELGMLPLYMSSEFYNHFTKRTKRRFLRYFLRVLRRTKVPRRKRRQLRKEVRKSIKTKTKRSVECTVGVITQVTISDDAFPFDYDDINQFDSCLSNATVKNNLAAITDKVDDEDYLRIVLRKLREAYSTGASAEIPEEQVQLLGPASRVATTEDINAWNITNIDTLSALMDSSDGPWDPSLGEAVVSKYLSVDGNGLGSAELNAIGGANLCSLDVDVLKTITEQSLKDANRLDVSNCTLEKKKAMFAIALNAFTSNARSTDPVSTYQLLSSYLGGATRAYIGSIVNAGVNMDMETFTGLDENVVLDLTVTEVSSLLGTNTPELKSYENQTLVRSWISRQQQSELDTLGLGLTGGKTSATVTVTPSTAATSSTKTTAAPAAPTTARPPSATTAGSATTTSNGPRLRPDLGLSILAVLVLILSAHV